MAAAQSSPNSTFSLIAYSRVEALHPDIRGCVRDGCSAIESEQHIFFDCLLASAME
ncbi:hypothetical protein Plhal703r1_c25g0106661 [Plasmopara halstedii]